MRRADGEPTLVILQTNQNQSSHTPEHHLVAGAPASAPRDLVPLQTMVSTRTVSSGVLT